MTATAEELVGKEMVEEMRWLTPGCIERLSEVPEQTMVIDELSIYIREHIPLGSRMALESARLIMMQDTGDDTYQVNVLPRLIPLIRAIKVLKESGVEVPHV